MPQGHRREAPGLVNEPPRTPQGHRRKPGSTRGAKLAAPATTDKIYARGPFEFEKAVISLLPGHQPPDVPLGTGTSAPDHRVVHATAHRRRTDMIRTPVLPVRRGHDPTTAPCTSPLLRRGPPRTPRVHPCGVSPTPSGTPPHHPWSTLARKIWSLVDRATTRWRVTNWQVPDGGAGSR